MTPGVGSTEYPASDAGSPSQPVSEAARPAGEPSDRTIEATALAGSAAIRRIIAERNELRRERERLLGLNDELRRQSETIAERNELRRERERLLALNDELLRQSEKTSRLRDRYRQLATELLVQLRQMSLTIQDVSRKAAHDLSLDTDEEKNGGLEGLARRWDTEQEKERDSEVEELARSFAPKDKAG